MNTAWLALLAIVVDEMFGEPRRGHPLVAFGRWARAVERLTYGDRRANGVMAWMLAVLPCCLLAWAVTALAAMWSVWAAIAVHTLLLYITIGLKSLSDHALPVIVALRNGDIAGARRAVGFIVSRDTEALDEVQIAAAATESMLENGNDAVFGALFWFALLGGPGAVAFRAANTLDAMWGYRTSRYLRFGWAAARIDDTLNYLPARLTALGYALCGRTCTALRCWRAQAPSWDSPNAGPVMASGAGAIGVRLGGPAPYHGEWVDRPVLGDGAAPDVNSIRGAVRLVRLGVALWLLAWLAVLEVVRHA